MKQKVRTVLFSGLAFVYLVLGCKYSSEAQNAPVTTAATISNAVAGQQVIIPVTVADFNNIGSISLTMDYDYSKLHFVSASVNPALSGVFNVGDNNMGNGTHRLIMGWFGNGITLPNGSYIVKYTFTYITGSAPLEWFDMGPSCEYTDDFGAILNDSPTSAYYINGLVQSQVDKQLQLSLLLEGLYNTGTHKLNYARNATANQFTGTTAEQISVELHDAVAYGNMVYTANNVNLDENGAATVTIPNGFNGSYYITIRHRNSIETVSSVPVSFAGSTVAYAFDSQSKAFGGNLKQVSDGSWVIFGGDANQDGSVDAGDMIVVDNDAASFATGYIVTDIDGNGIVDQSDFTIPVINAENFIQKITP